MKFMVPPPPNQKFSYYTTETIVYLDITNKTYLENDNFFWKYASEKNLFWYKQEQY